MKIAIDVARFMLSITVGASTLWFTEWLFSIPLVSVTIWQGLAFFVFVPVLFKIGNDIREGKYF